MTLQSETTVEYRFRDAYLFYCKHHDTLGVSEAHEDSVQLSGVTQENINDFISTYFEYVLDDAPMKEYFKERLAKVKEEEEIDKLIEDVS
jgi:hypothetical protein